MNRGVSLTMQDYQLNLGFALDKKRRREEQSWNESHYSLAIFPEGETGESVKGIVSVIKERYAPDTVNVKNPSIELATFRAREAMEDTLIRWIQRICNTQSRFWVTLNNFCGLPPDCIYLRILDHHPFRQLNNKLQVIDQYLQSSGSGPVNWPKRPYCRLADGLPPDQYERMLTDFSREEFFGSFRVYNLVLLKQEAGGETETIVNVFPLYP